MFDRLVVARSRTLQFDRFPRPACGPLTRSLCEAVPIQQHFGTHHQRHGSRVSLATSRQCPGHIQSEISRPIYIFLPRSRDFADVLLGSIPSWRLTIFVTLAALAVLLTLPFVTTRSKAPLERHSFGAYEPVRPLLAISDEKRPDPIRWLQENSNNKYAMSGSMLHLRGRRRPRAAIISLVRNSELAGMMQSIRQLELRWNRKYQVSLFLPSFIR